MYQRVGNAAFKKGLGNTLALLSFLGDPHLPYPKLHIAGTNGKGTVSHMLAACYQAAGCRVGLYTSPHYVDFRERFKIDGEMVSKKYIREFVKRIKPAIAEIRPSFFEITVAMAFDAFRAAGVEIAIIETGLGGRLDSTNVIDPVISVITNISYDHMEMLGDTLELIATEKAGIIKPGRPVVIGKTQVETTPVFEKFAAERNASLTYADAGLSCTVTSRTVDMSYCVIRGINGLESSFMLPSRSPFVCENLTTTLAAIQVANGTGEVPVLQPDQVKQGIEDFIRLTNYVGRWQILGKDPLIVADSAHNEAGLAKAMLDVRELAGETLHIVLGVVREKDLSRALKYFPTGARYYFCKPDVPRGLDAHLLREAALEMGLQGKVYSTVRRALSAAKRTAKKEDTIFVGGSSFVVAEVV